MELLNRIQKELKAPKNHHNKFGDFNYRSCEDILEAVKPLLGSGTLTLTDEVVCLGDRYYIKATATLKDGKDQESTSAFAREKLERPKFDDGQLTGAASSYARKYALNGLFLIDDTKDADSDESSKTAPEAVRQPMGRPKPPPYKSDGIKMQEAKKRIADLILKLTDEEAPSDKEEAGKWYAEKVEEFTSLSLPLAESLEGYEKIGDELGKLFDSQR